MRVYFKLFRVFLKIHWLIVIMKNLRRKKGLFYGDTLIIGGYNHGIDYLALNSTYKTVIVLGFNSREVFEDVMEHVSCEELVLLQMPFHEPLVYRDFITKLDSFITSENFNYIFSNQMGIKTYWSSTSLVSALALVGKGSNVDLIGVDYNDYVLKDMPYNRMSISLFRTAMTSLEIENISCGLHLRILNPNFYFYKAIS